MGLAVRPRHRCQVRVFVVVADEADVLVIGRDREDVVFHALAERVHPLNARDVLRIDLVVEGVARLDRLVDDLVHHVLRHLRGRTVCVAERRRRSLEDPIEQLADCLRDQAPVGEVGGLLQFGVQLLPLRFVEHHLDTVLVDHVRHQPGLGGRHRIAQRCEVREGRGAVQHVVRADERVHGLQVHEDRPEREDGGHTAHWAVGLHRGAGQPGEDVGRPEVREV
mmetsp:Transcript_27643/g.69948  ORF Transcript_27643/g.69948 Transcript_27643/m.69948 type:complete len:223 (+) Transcript_27643:386-1054(+)